MEKLLTRQLNGANFEYKSLLTTFLNWAWLDPCLNRKFQAAMAKIEMAKIGGCNKITSTYNFHFSSVEQNKYLYISRRTSYNSSPWRSGTGGWYRGRDCSPHSLGSRLCKGLSMLALSMKFKTQLYDT